MKTFLRALAGFLLCAMLFTFTLWRNDAFPDLSALTAFVQDTAGRLDTISQIPDSGISAITRPKDEGAQFPEYSLSEEIDPELEQLICEAMLAHATEVDLSEYHLNDDSLQAVVSAIRFTHPELFFVDKTFTFSRSTSTGVVQLLKPQYTHSAEQVATMMAEYEATVAAIVAGAPANGTDFDKLLYVHDYFVKGYEYDYTYTIRDAYTFFKEKTGVCQAYMLAMIAVCEEMGIQSIPVTSNRMNHAWNMVLLDGQWYHIDVTWDDAVSYPAYVSYTYFLQSDAGMIAIDADKVDEGADEVDWHCDWLATSAATDTRYDKAAWRESGAPIVKCGDTYYCVVSEPDNMEQNVSGAVYSGTDPVQMTRTFAINCLWRLSGTSHCYVDCYTGLAVHGGELIYNTSNTLRAYNPATGTDRLLGIMDVGSDCIFGLMGVSDQGVVSYLVSPVASGGQYRILQHTIA